MNTNRPAGIALITMWLFLSGLFALAATAAPLFALDLFGGVGLSGAAPIVGAVVMLAITIAYFAMGWGLWELREWARLATVALAGLGLIFGLIAAVIFLFGIEVLGTRLSLPGLGIAFLIEAVINGLAIWYLLRSDIQALFGGGQAVAGAGYPGATWGQAGAGVSFGVGEGSTATGMPPDWNITGPRSGGGSLPPAQASMPVGTSGSAIPVVDQTRPLQEPEPVLGWLVVRSGPRAGEQLKLRAGSNVVGRDGRQSQVLVEDSSVSGEHAKIRWENGVFVIYDMASTNGTFVNDRRIEKQRLMDGDTVRMGRMEFTFKQLDSRHDRTA